MAAGGILVTVWAQSPTPTRLPAEQPFHHTHPILPCHALHNRFVVALPTILHALWERHSMEQQADPLAPPQKQNFHMQAFREAISAIRRLPVPAGPPEETRAVTAKSRCEWKQKRLKFSIRITCLHETLISSACVPSVKHLQALLSSSPKELRRAGRLQWVKGSHLALLRSHLDSEAATLIQCVPIF